MLYSDQYFELFRDDPYKFSPILPKYKAQPAEEIYKTWLKNRLDTEENFAEFVNQLDWRVGQELAAEYQSKFGDVYYYLFSQPSPNEKLRSCHAVDLPYTFNNPDRDLEPNPKLVKQFKRRGQLLRRQAPRTTNLSRTGKNIPSTIAKLWSLTQKVASYTRI